MTVVVFGTICLDRLRRIDRLPVSGAYAEVRSEQWMLGGEASNTACNLKRWGAEVRLAGNAIGIKDQGELIANLLAERGVWVESREGGEDDHYTPICDIYVAQDGDRTMFGFGFSGMEADLSLIPMLPGAWFTAEPNLGESAREAVKQAQAAGMKCYLMDFFQPSDPIRPGDYWQSSTDWVGTRGNTQKNVAWVKQFVESHGTVTILSDGPNGFVMGSPNHRTRAFAPYPAPTVEDMTGAGDAFRAGMLFGLSQGWELSTCLKFASAAGSLSCGHFGGSNGPTVTEIEEFLAAHPEVGDQYG